MAVAASSASVASVPVDNFMNILTCPVNHQPLVDAVTLVPCMHKINAGPALRIFGGELTIPLKGMKLDGFVNKSQLCPHLGCKSIVTAYYVDDAYRSVVKALLASKDIVGVPFPGKRAFFQIINDCWGLPGQAMAELSFASCTPDSLFDEVIVLGKHDRSIGIYIRVEAKHRNAVATYMEALGIPLEKYDKVAGRFRAESHKDVKMLFRVLDENNDIPSKYREVIRLVVEEGRW